MKQITVRLIVVGIIVSLWSVAARADKWYQKYEAALEAIEDEEWSVAIELLEAAIQEQDEPAKRKRTHGMYFIEYYPYLHLGRAYLQIGEPQQAREYCEKSAKFGVAPQDKVNECLEPPTPTPIPPTPIPTPGDDLKLEILSHIPQETDANTLEIKGKATSGNGLDRVEVTVHTPLRGIVKTTQVKIEAQDFTAIVPLDVGLNVILVTATDAINQITEEVRIIRNEDSTPVDLPPVPTAPPQADRSLPQIFVDDIPEEVEEETIEVRGEVRDDEGLKSVIVKNISADDDKRMRGLQIAVAPELLRRGEKRYSFKQWIKLNPGPNTILISAIDLTGQETRRKFDIFRKIETPGTRGNVWAVIIGINEYKNERLNLQFAANDAQTLYDILVDPHYAGIPKENIKLLLNEDATTENIKHAIGEWLEANVSDQDTVIVYYAGHGMRKGDEAYWVTYNANPNRLFSTALDNTVIPQMFKRVQPKRLITFLDACYSAATMTRSLLEEIPWEKFAGEGRVTITATTSNQLSLEDDKWEHGIFTYRLLEGLRGQADGAAGQAKDGMVELDEIWNYVHNHVQEDAKQRGHEQEPMWKAEDYSGRILLTYNTAFFQELKEQRQQELQRNQTKLKDLHEQGQLSDDVFECASTMVANGTSSPILDALLAGEKSPDTFMEEFTCGTSF